MATKFSSRSRRLSFQPLEERAMMAAGTTNILGGNVGVIVIDGDLYVTGDSAANKVAIVQTQQNGTPVNGSYYIAGLDGTTINGSATNTVARNTFTGVTRDFRIDMKGGGDNLLLGPDPTISQPSPDKFTVPRDLNVEMGSNGVMSNDHSGSATFYANGITVGHNAVINSGYAHDDHFYLIRGNFNNDVKIKSQADSAYVTMWYGSVSNDLNIGASSYASANDIRQQISLYKMNIGHNATITHDFGTVSRDVAGDLVWDDINTVGVNNTFTIDSGIAHSQIYLEKVTQRDLNVYMNRGFDYGNDNSQRLELKNVGVYGTAWLIGGNGNDRFDIQGTFPNLLVYGRYGNDTVLIHDSMIGSLGITEYSLSYSHNTISLSNNYIGGNASIYTGSSKDTVSVDTVTVYNRLTIDTGDGDDNVSITNSAADELFALLGAGDDTLNLTTVRARRSALDGGDGTDSLYLAGDIALAVYQDATRFQHIHYPWEA